MAADEGFSTSRSRPDWTTGLPFKLEALLSSWLRSVNRCQRRLATGAARRRRARSTPGSQAS